MFQYIQEVVYNYTPLLYVSFVAITMLHILLHFHNLGSLCRQKLMTLQN